MSERFVVMVSKIIKAWQFAQINGIFNLLRAIYRHLAVGKKSFSKVNIFKKYEFVNLEHVGDLSLTDGVLKNTVNWFVPEIGKGSGGHLNIFRFIKNLEKIGIKNRIIIIEGGSKKSSARIKADIENWFFPIDADVFTDATLAPPSYFSIATSWKTAYYVRSYLSTVKRCYFVQDFEPWFYPAGTDALLAEATYSFGFYGFTAGKWLADKLNEVYSMHALALGFSFDRNLYKPYPRQTDSRKRIFFYARPPTARRGFELGLLVLDAVAKRLPDVQVVMAGWNVREYEIPFEVEHVGLMDLHDLPALYSSCDVALVLSCSNLSLLPLELMACGVPVVTNRGPQSEWLLNERNAVLSPPTIEGLSSSIIDLLRSPDRAQALRIAGINFAQQTSWEEQALLMANQLKYLADEKNSDLKFD